MSASKPQSYANHSRFDPLFHYFLAPMLLITVILAILHLVRRPSFTSVWLALLSVVLLFLAVKVRLYALKVQDRLIRLEERLRLMQLLPEPLRSRIGELTVPQLVGLRFASDAELPGLAERAMNEKLTQRQIKQAIQNWRPDYFRA